MKRLLPSLMAATAITLAGFIPAASAQAKPRTAGAPISLNHVSVFSFASVEQFIMRLVHNIECEAGILHGSACGVMPMAKPAPIITPTTVLAQPTTTVPSGPGTTVPVVIVPVVTVPVISITVSPGSITVNTPPIAMPAAAQASSVCQSSGTSSAQCSQSQTISVS